MDDLRPLGQPPQSDIWEGVPLSQPPVRRPWLLITVFILVGLGLVGVLNFGNDSRTPSSGKLLASPSLTVSPQTIVSPVSTEASMVSSASPPKSPLVTCPTQRYTALQLGLAFAYPDGWQPVLANGLILLRRPSQPSDLIYIVPVTGPTDAVSSRAKELGRVVSEVMTHDANQLLFSDDQFNGSLDGKSVHGEARVINRDTYQLVLGGWSTTTEAESIGETLTNIGQCFTLEPGTRFDNEYITRDGESTPYLQIALPADWQGANLSATNYQVTVNGDEGQGLIRLEQSIAQSGTQSLDGIFVLGLQNSTATEVVVVAEQTLPDQIDELDNRWQFMAREYTAKHQGETVHGVMIVGLTTDDDGWGYGTYSTLIAVRQSEESNWSTFDPLGMVVLQSVRFQEYKPGKGVTFGRVRPGDELGTFSSAQFLEELTTLISDPVQKVFLEYVLGRVVSDQNHTGWIPAITPSDPQTGRYTLTGKTGLKEVWELVPAP